ncbi:hypothetical protein XENORESO_003523 [Xenotaenia resolanae]|uniref:Uncharacterized protein n=1 Tax=Xenotaenia resolanae TaxID=208358 RepID=A0ABV0XA98_9TELE
MPCPYGPDGIRQIQKGGRREELKGVGGVKHSMFVLFFFFFLHFYHGDCTGVPKPKRGQERGGSCRELPSQEKKKRLHLCLLHGDLPRPPPPTHPLTAAV